MNATPTRHLMPSTLRTALIMLAAGVAASLLCAPVFAAPLPIEALAPAPVISASATAQKVDDAAAAATLRAFIAGQRSFAGIVPASAAPASAQLR